MLLVCVCRKMCFLPRYGMSNDLSYQEKDEAAGKWCGRSEKYNMEVWYDRQTGTKQLRRLLHVLHQILSLWWRFLRKHSSILGHDLKVEGHIINLISLLLQVLWHGFKYLVVIHIRYQFTNIKYQSKNETFQKQQSFILSLKLNN